MTFFQLVTHGVKARGAEVALQARAFQLAVASLMGGSKEHRRLNHILKCCKASQALLLKKFLGDFSG